MADAATDAAAEGGEKEVFRHPETGEVISKNAWKKLQKGAPEKVKKEKPVAAAAPAGEKKEAKAKKEKEPEVVFVDNTPQGEKKLIAAASPPTYQPTYVEAAWQAWWEKCGFYAPDVERALKSEQKDKFVMVIPPPNVTGSLHLGHALTVAVEDTLTRWHRMHGKIALWVPGTDHAGIATQSVVEKRLLKDHKIMRRDLGREEFLKRVWEWKETYGNRITTQIRCLGASVDWSREAFTMDKNLSAAVVEAFVRFHESGLVFRAKRLINWSCALQSAISDIEVDHLELDQPTKLTVPGHTERKEGYEFGTILSFAYEVDEPDEASGCPKEIVVATTRLETMLGDTAVAVHPDDPRYKALHGKMLKHPFVDRKIPIVCDGKLVDMSFGTGAVKVTPAHDPNDYNCGKRNNLPFIVMLTSDGKISPGCGKFSGMMRYDARIAVEQELTALGLFRGRETNKMSLGRCSRTGDIIEPMLSPQWYVNCTSMAQRSIDAVKKGDLKILPEMHEATWFKWLENIQDWCVSRQLWWGHRIPAYFARLSGETPSSVDKGDDAYLARWFVARSEQEALQAAAAALGADPSSITLEQDEDVLDTWFSSGLFPFSVFGWPNPTADFKAFYPTSLLETGLDILFFWVARMVMMGLQLTDTLPFTTVYLHAMVRDKEGRKMSKSLGNVIDPLEVKDGCTLEDLYRKIEEGNLKPEEVERSKENSKKDFPDGIPACGTDALRFGLLAYTVQGRDVNLDIKRVVGYRQFCNKLWNAVRFALTYISDFTPSGPAFYEAIAVHPGVSKRDLFILSRLSTTVRDVDACLADYNFGTAVSMLHSFFLYDVCDTYVELVKPVLSPWQQDAEAQAQAQAQAPSADRRFCAQATLYTVIEQYLRLLHPIMPFVTEELWQRLPNRAALQSTESIMIAPYPAPVLGWISPSVEADMAVVKDAINGARSVRADYKIPNHVKVAFFFRTEAPEVRAALLAQADDFCFLAKAQSLQWLGAQEEPPAGCSLLVLSDRLTLLVNLTGVVDIDVELTRLGKEAERLRPLVDSYRRKMAMPGYDKVPEAVRTLNTEKLAGAEAELAVVEAAIADFAKMRT